MELLAHEEDVEGSQVRLRRAVKDNFKHRGHDRYLVCEGDQVDLMKNSFSEVCSRMGFGILSSGRGGSPAHVSGGLQNGGGGGDAEDPWESLCSQPPADFGGRFCQRWDR